MINLLAFSAVNEDKSCGIWEQFVRVFVVYSVFLVFILLMKKPDGKRVENFVHTMNQKRTIYFRLWTSGKRHKRLYMSELHEFLNWKNSLPSKKIKHWMKNALWN